MLHVLTHYCLDIFPQLALISIHQLTFSEHFNLIGRTIGPRILSYTRCRELVKESLLAIGVNSVSFSTHSLRSSGATFIADDLAKSGSSVRLLMLHGRWKSETAKNMYVKDSLDSRLQLTRLFPTFGLEEM